MRRSNATQNTQNNRLLWHFPLLPHFDISNCGFDIIGIISWTDTQGNMERVDPYTALTKLW